MKNFKKLTGVLNQLKKLQNVIDDKKFDESTEPLRKLGYIISELKMRKDEVLPYVKKEVKDIILRNPIKVSALELMEYKFHENSHSNILQYLFDYNYFKRGAELLEEFILGIEGLENKKELARIIREKKYEVKREVSVDGGRIDILITAKNMAIVLENKILSDVTKKENDDLESEGKISKKQRTQLDTYRYYAERHYSKKSHFQAFIILSFKQLSEEFIEKCKPFVYVDYSYLHEVLNKFESPDNILQEYQLLLHSLTKGIENKIWLIKQTKNFKKMKNLFYLDQIKTLINEN